ESAAPSTLPTLPTLPTLRRCSSHFELWIAPPLSVPFETYAHVASRVTDGGPTTLFGLRRSTKPAPPFEVFVDELLCDTTFAHDCPQRKRMRKVELLFAGRGS